MLKKFILIFIVLISSINLSACWNYKDIETLGIVAGAAIDKDVQNNNYILTIEVANQKSEGKGGQFKSQIIESTGDTVFDAIRNAITKSGKKLFWSHCQVVIVSKDIAREGIIQVLDFFTRHDEIRADVHIIISAANTAEEILKTPVESNDIVSFYLNNTLESYGNVSKSIPNEQIQFMNEISTKTTSATAPVVNIKTYNNKTIPEISGSAVFKNDKLEYFINGQESEIALMIRDDLKGGLLTLQETNLNANMKITLEILGSKTKINPSIENGIISMKIDTKMQVEIGELEGSVDFINKDNSKILKKDIENKIANEIKNLVTKTQNNSSTDIFDFSGTIQRKMPNYWRKVEGNWDEIYKSLKIQPNVEIDIISSGKSQKSIKIGD